MESRSSLGSERLAPRMRLRMSTTSSFLRLSSSLVLLVAVGILLVTLEFSPHFVAAASGSSPKHGADHQHVTCGSVIKLTHKTSGYKLHSHDVKYGTGSGQQSITAFPNADDSNSLFAVRGPFGERECVRGEPIRCGQKARLLHVNSKK